MQLSSKTLEYLSNIITGDSKRSPYRKGPELIDFFYEFGERDLYGQGFPTRRIYALEKLKKFNGTKTILKIIPSAFDYIESSEFNAESAAEQFNLLLTRDGYRIAKEYRGGWMEGDKHVKGHPYFTVCKLETATVVPESLIQLTHESINEHIKKSNTKISNGDFAGAITNAYTLVESVLKLLLSKLSEENFGSKGDIRSLYSELAPLLNLEPKGERLESYLKSILQGLKSQITGLYELANKAADRHDRKYNPSKHHAKLAISSAFCLCEFLIDSLEYQTMRDKNQPR